MSVLKIVHPDPEDKGEILSGCTTPNGDIYINVEFIWNQTRCFNKFTKYFSKVYEHELIHRLIQEELKNTKRLQVNEERIVRKMTNEQYRKWHKLFYKREDKK